VRNNVIDDFKRAGDCFSNRQQKLSGGMLEPLVERAVERWVLSNAGPADAGGDGRCPDTKVAKPVDVCLRMGAVASASCTKDELGLLLRHKFLTAAPCISTRR
jgi:hypothetical protein